ncbi:MAG: hypothetical protein LBH48_00965 [Bifidobacteriaceae bacterium]|jgi:hypothetical protein|nr:hypothetical protein [Bifidobacteriaceae bacterium]
MDSPQLVERLTTAIQRDLGAPETWVDIRAYVDSMAECLIDALWSERVRYSVVAGIIGRYRSYRSAIGADADHDSAQDLLDTFGIGLGRWMDTIGNRQRAFSRDDAPFKAELVRAGAGAAVTCGVTTTEALRRGQARGTVAFNDLKSRWLQLPAQHSGLTWERLLLVAGVPGVPPDGWVIEYVSRALDPTGARPATPHQAQQIVHDAATSLGSSELRLRNAIWRFETKRDRAAGHGPKGTHRTQAGAIANEG